MVCISALVYQPETCRDLLKLVYQHCEKVLSKDILIKIFDDVIANRELVPSQDIGSRLELD